MGSSSEDSRALPLTVPQTSVLWEAVTGSRAMRSFRIELS